MAPEKPSYRPLHLQIRDLLRARIASGSWPAGAPIPSEIALAAEFAVSTGTIRKALDALVASHLIVRHRGRGSFVASHSRHEALYRWFSIEPDDGRRCFPDDEVLARERGAATQRERALLDLPPDEFEVLRLFRRRHVRGQAMIRDVLVLPSHMFPGFDWPGAQHRFTTPYEYYEGEHGIKVIKVEETVKAELANSDDAVLLGLKAGSPLLTIRRIAMTFDDRPVEFRFSRVRPDGYSYVKRIS